MVVRVSAPRERPPTASAGRTFQRRRESFACDHCGVANAGSGYTNHCAACLWSKHVDVHPGDRREMCGGLMAPVALDRRHGHDVVVHRCERCGVERTNRLASNDDRDAIVAVGSTPAGRRLTR